MAPARNLVSLNAVEKGYGTHSVLRHITLGVSAGDRIGVVGANGDGKSTLLRLITGVQTPGSGAVTRAKDVDTVARPPRESATAPPGAVVRAAGKEIRRLEAALNQLATNERGLRTQMELSSSDHVRLSELDGQLAALAAEREQLETAWLEVSETLEP